MRDTEQFMTEEREREYERKVSRELERIKIKDVARRRYEDQKRLENKKKKSFSGLRAAVPRGGSRSSLGLGRII